MLLNLDPKYKNAYKRLEVLEQQFEYEIHSVSFYLEAYLCYQEKPTLLKKLGPFELQVLNFASKYRLMTKELALYVSNFVSQQKRFHEPMFRILERVYKMYSEPMILNTICTLLIKGNKTQGRYFAWYQRAVDAELKIAQLYEYYMMTLDEENVKGPLPKSILLYFMHGNTLNYKKAALLYANLVTYEEQAGDLYLSYREQMSGDRNVLVKMKEIWSYLLLSFPEKKKAGKRLMKAVRMEDYLAAVNEILDGSDG